MNARADQFAFCVALYEAVYRQHPFDAGGSVRDLVTAATSGRILPPPRRVSLPPGVATALRRGLAREPNKRFPSMVELLGALRRRSVAALPIALAAFSGIALAAVAGGIAYARYEKGMICAGAGAKLAGVWDDERQRGLLHAFRATGIASADDTFSRMKEALDAYIHDWTEMHRGACEATHVRHEQSPEVLDLRVECLDERLEDLRAQLDVFSHASALTVEKAVQAVHALPKVRGCADAVALRAPIRPPADEETRRRVEQIHVEIAQAKAEQRAGDYSQALALATKSADEAAALGYRPVEAEALYVLGDVQDDRGDYARSENTLRASFAAALAGHHEPQAARTLAALVAEVGLRQARFAEAHEWARLAAAEIERSSDPFVKGELAKNEGRVFVREGKYDDARAAIENCLSIWEPALGKDDYSVAGAVTDLGNVFFEKGDLAAARAQYSRSLAIIEKLLGPDSPSLAPNLNNLGELSLNLGDYAVAAQSLERARSLWERALGPDHPKVALALLNLSRARSGLGDVTASLEMAQRALAIWQAALPAEHPDVAMGMHGVAEALRAKGEYDGALATEERALVIREKVYGPDAGDVAESLVSIGETRLAQGSSAAIAPLLRALRILESEAGHALDLAQVRFDLARALAPSEAARGRALAAEARAAYASATSTFATKRTAEVDAWLAAHGGAP